MIRFPAVVLATLWCHGWKQDTGPCFPRTPASSKGDRLVNEVSKTQFPYSKSMPGDNKEVPDPISGNPYVSTLSKCLTGYWPNMGQYGDQRPKPKSIWNHWFQTILPAKCSALPEFCNHHNCWFKVQSKGIMASLRQAVIGFNPTALGFKTKEIEARSVWSGGTMALLCGNVDTDKIRLLGCWNYDAMLQCLHIQALPLSYHSPNAWLPMETSPCSFGGGGPSRGHGLKLASIIHVCLDEHSVIWDGGEVKHFTMGK